MGHSRIASVLSLAALAATLLAPAPAASDLKLDGGTQASVAYGDNFLLELSGGPNLPGWVFIDVSPGPISLFGESIPIGFTGAFSQLLAMSTPASGDYAVSFPLPQNSSLSGASIYLIGVLLDPSDPNGLDFSNNARLDIVPPVGAGANQGTFIGRTVTLDGSGSAQADGSLPPGALVSWQLLSSPPGSVASPDNAGAMFATFTPDVPGDYTFRFTIDLGGASQSAETTVHAWDLSWFPEHEGTWTTASSLNATGQVNGPGLSSVTIDGNVQTVAPTGFFGPHTVSVPAGSVFSSYTVELSHADGSVARDVIHYGIGTAAPLSAGANSSLVGHVRQDGIDEIAQLGEGELETVDLEQFLLDLPPHQLINDEGLFGFTIFSATIDFTSMNYNPDMDLALTATSSGLQGMVNLYNVNVDFDVWGEVLEIDYNITGDMQSSPIDLAATITGSVQNGNLVLTLSNVDVVRNNFNFNLDGFLGSIAELFIIEDGVKADVEATIETELSAQLVPAISEILNGFELSLPLLDLLQVDVDVDIAWDQVTHTNGGMGIRFDASTSVNSVEPGAPRVNNYRFTPTSAPNFGPLSPSGQLYAEALAVNDDFVNLFLAATTSAGLLNGDLTELFPDDPGSPGEVLTTEALELLFPGAGFELFPSGTELGLRSAGVVPPVVITTPGGPGQARICLAGLEVNFEVDDGVGGVIPVLRVLLEGHIDVNADIDGTGTLNIALVDDDITAQVLSGFPGSNLTSLQAGADFLISLLVPQLLDTIGVIPIPSLEEFGLILTAEEIALTGGNSEYLGFWGSVTFTTP